MYCKLENSQLLIEDFAEILKTKRSARGLTQHEMAKSIDLGLRQYQRFERGEQWPNIIQLISLSNLLEYDFLSHVSKNELKGGGGLSEGEDRAYQLRNSAILGTILDAVGEILSIQKGQTVSQVVQSLEEAVKSKEVALRVQHGGRL